jgi:hypothetical protein
MSLWKYTDATQSVAFRTTDNSGMESRISSQIADPILPADPVTKQQAKAAALAAATAAGCPLDLLRIIRALAMLADGNATQKTKARAFLAPLLQLCNDAKAVAAAIDADAVPLPIVPPILGTDDP